MKKLTLALLFSYFLMQATAQGTNYDYERIRIGDAKHIVSGLALSPDNTTLAISSIQGYPFYLFDWKNKDILKQYDVGNWYAGSSVTYSAGGKYVLLNQLYYIDFALNKDREVNFEIIQTANGEQVKRFEEYHSVAITPDEKYALTLTGDEFGFWNLVTKKKEKSFKIVGAANSIAINPDGKRIAISRRLTEEDAQRFPAMQRDKKTLKLYMKYKQLITVYDAETFKEIYTVNELYDIIYKLKFSKDGEWLLCLNIPHTKLQNTDTDRQSYINVVDAETGEARRRGFVSKSYYEPDFKVSHNGKYLGLVSQNNRFMELHIYDFETGKMRWRFQQSYRLFEKDEEGFLSSDTRISFVFLSDDESVMMTGGNYLILWNLTKSQ